MLSAQMRAPFIHCPSLSAFPFAGSEERNCVRMSVGCVAAKTDHLTTKWTLDNSIHLALRGGSCLIISPPPSPLLPLMICTALCSAVLETIAMIMSKCRNGQPDGRTAK